MNITGLPARSDRHAGGWSDALGIGLPDAITCLGCLWVWLHPLAFGPDAVRCVVLMLVMEFFLIHATGFYMCIPFLIHFRRRVRIAMLVALCALYFLLIASFASTFHVVWPYFAFAWMTVAKIAWIVRNRRITADEQIWIVGNWAVSVVAYLGAVGIGAILAMPHLGITTELAASLHLPGHGEWIDEPHRAVASAVMYFAALAAFKWLYLAMRRRQQGPRRSPVAGGIAGDTLGRA
ncbi:MAG: hypothetical protein JSS45_11460 [Proteobacteria bacterium]|nr:hypothetical protein [Pseudomonadota bacterium]